MREEREERKASPSFSQPSPHLLTHSLSSQRHQPNFAALMKARGFICKRNTEGRKEKGEERRKGGPQRNEMSCGTKNNT